MKLVFWTTMLWAHVALLVWMAIINSPAAVVFAWMNGLLISISLFYIVDGVWPEGET